MAANDRGYGMVGPQVLYLVSLEARLVILVGPAIGQAFAPLAVASEIHGDRDIAAFGPELGPFGESRAAAAVDQHHGGQFLFDLVRLRVIGKDARRLALVGLAVIEQPAQFAVL